MISTDMMMMATLAGAFVVGLALDKYCDKLVANSKKSGSAGAVSRESTQDEEDGYVPSDSHGTNNDHVNHAAQFNDEMREQLADQMAEQRDQQLNDSMSSGLSMDIGNPHNW